MEEQEVARRTTGSATVTEHAVCFVHTQRGSDSVSVIALPLDTQMAGFIQLHTSGVGGPVLCLFMCQSFA